jgi:signal transduction histidine kinase
MNTLAELYIFEMLPKEQRIPNKVGWWSNVQQGKQVPYAFARGMLLTSDVGMVIVAVLISITAITAHTPGIVIVAMELLFACTWVLLLLARRFKRILPIVGVYLVVVGLSILLNLVFAGMWGSVALYILCVTVLYRFPLVWSLPMAGVCVLVLITTGGVLQLLPVPHIRNSGMLAFNLVLACGLCWFGWTRRTQYLLVMRLHEAQEQLREQMVRREELATERERTRIARDIHDVLSHSLAVLSIQVQAARQLRTRDPERLAAKLDDMATLIRESITESRRVVGLLREKAPTPYEQDNLSANLRLMATTFNERTGIHCRFEESGTPHTLSPQQRETLQLALREMLTNAHRHGAAQTVWITLQWQEADIILEMRDDGMGVNAAHPGTLTEENDNGVGGHHGLQGMRERADSLGGEVEAGPAETGGFTVSLRLPYERSAARFAQRGKHGE